MDRDMSVLVTSGRFPPTTGLVRALARSGVRVDVADSYALSPALHSRAVRKMHVVAPAAGEPVRFTQDVAEIARNEKIDMIVPTFEEGFYLARYVDLLPVPLFAPPFETIKRLHDKATFLELCRELDLPTPETIVVASRDGLRKAVAQFDDFVARPAFSRGGMTYLTNHGPRASENTVDNCAPTSDNPWLVQPYVEGDDACSFSVAREGRVVLHCIYEPTLANPGGWSVQFGSIEDFGTLEIASKICAELGVTGFAGFDYRRTKDGVVMMECNPRCSAGVFLTPAEWIGEAVFGDPGDLRVVEPGHRRQYDAFLLDRDTIKLPARELVHALMTTPDAYFTPRDLLPSIYSLITRNHWSKLAERDHLSVGEAFIGDMSWNGTPMPDEPPS